jgi:hypothetical protein
MLVRSLALLTPVLALAERPTFHVSAGARVTKTYEEVVEVELQSLRVWSDGEEVPAEDVGELQLSIESHDKYVFSDHYVAVGDGRPAVLERTFDELGTQSVERAKFDEESDESTKERESALEGKTVVFTWSDESDAFATAFKGEDGDRELLDGLVEDTDLRVFLPAKSVAEGDTWEVEAKAFNALSFPGGELSLVATEEEDDPLDRGQLRENVEGQISAKYAGKREVDGRELDVIALKLSIRTHADDEGDIEDGPHRSRKFAIEHELEGELLWSSELGRAHSLAVEGRSEIAMTEELTFDTDEGDVALKQEFAFAGTTRFAAAFEKAD